MQSQLQYSELEGTVFSIERQFHVLKHFKRIDREYVRYLKENSVFTDADITHQLKVKGSDFCEGFSPNPEVLWQNLKKKIRHDKMEAFWSDGKCEIELEFSRSEYPEGIGEDHLVHIDELPPGVLDLVDKGNWKSLRRLAYKAEPKSTWILHIILGRTENTPEVISIFPGTYAPQLPDKELQNEEDYERSIDFWTSHVVLKP